MTVAGDLISCINKTGFSVTEFTLSSSTRVILTCLSGMSHQFFLILKKSNAKLMKLKVLLHCWPLPLNWKRCFCTLASVSFTISEKKVYIAFQHSIAALWRQLQPMKISTNGNVVYSQTTLPLHHQWMILPVSHNLPFHSLLHRWTRMIIRWENMLLCSIFLACQELSDRTRTLPWALHWVHAPQSNNTVCPFELKPSAEMSRCCLEPATQTQGPTH